MTSDDLTPSTRAIPAEFDDAVVWAAWLYYENQLTQNEIAAMIGVSRATIVNYLQEARQRGVVRILMNSEILARTSIARKLAAKFGLAEALVIPTEKSATPDANLKSLGAGGARLIERMVAPGETICVSWGRTVLAIADAIALPRPVEGLTVVQVTGSSSGKREFSAELCTSIMARNMGATSINMLAPTVLSTAALRDALMGEPVLKRQFELIGQADMIVYGVGGLAAESTMRIADVTTDEEIDAYAREGAVAVLICRFLDRDGKQIVRDFDRRIIGIELDELRSVPRRLCVAGGIQKVEAIRAVLAGGYATHLVTDAQVAERLLAD
ncbi:MULTISPECIES: sugar-binding transcriptional regulator [unclassified Rhizobium]|jgi:DNA-binding transcriptional regulator LsrR (DeoR family)|uniref:sugar-binding transcriptional regulator n=1 Tax=unclassified Rhizobium TaxID=2613769 RepID=UPI000646310A|nr:MULTISPECIES: sugar-binding transcriptional regulator [unclassified Rhizobium]MBN8952672.1 sugar-binding transcriptional regulator [Rhizobium tropici]OJY64472.1 MAG: AsnC family transcriptional regulator [Rhizobium sp. 60-20]RKD72700.1 DNA-binding transcriptional regulator LsrR (DeoR family) [Rhizobium sp. WW_1]